MLQEFVHELEKTAKSIMNDVHTALPGEIVSYDATKGTVTAKPIGKYATVDNKLLDYPNVTEAPVVFPYCGKSGVGIAYPIKPGDSCLIIISEVELDEWRSGSKSEGPLRYDMTNAIVIPGLLKKGGNLFQKAVSEDAVVIAAGSTEVIVTKSGVGLTTPGVTVDVSEIGITARGDLKIEGNIICNGNIQATGEASASDVKAGNISLINHTHISAEPGSSTSAAQ